MKGFQSPERMSVSEYLGLWKLIIELAKFPEKYIRKGLWKSHRENCLVRLRVTYRYESGTMRLLEKHAFP